MTNKFIRAGFIAGCLLPIMTLAKAPDEIGQVMLLGAVTAHSPMWQWTVNDYPFGALDADAKQQDRQTDGVRYLLPGRPFIAVSAYMPSFVSLTERYSSQIGAQDKTRLLDEGEPIAQFVDEGTGAVSFPLSVSGQSLSGEAIKGTLTLKATELRAFRYAYLSGEYVEKWLVVYGTTQPQYAIDNGSCFVGAGRYSAMGSVVSGLPGAPLPGEQSPTAFSALVQALSQSDLVGVAPKFASFKADYETVTNSGRPCSTATLQNVVVTAGMENKYHAGAHVLELTPVALTFPEPAVGAWSGVLTVEAYQM